MGPLKLFYRCRYECLKTLYWTPIVLVLCLVVWNYYVNVFVLNLSGQYTQPFSAILVLGSHCLLFLQLLSFIRTIFTKHKPIPSKFVLSTEQLDTMNSLVDIQPFILKLAANLPLKQLTSPDGGIRYCSHCKLIKPDRCHHCSSCGRCILKMDHHCYLVNNCLGYSNYKYFFLFLMYTITLGLGFCIFSFHDVTHIWKDTYNNKSINKNNVIFCFGFVGFFSISTTCQFFVHLYLILVNRTFLENLSTIRGPERRFYYLGIRRNLRAVFGRNIILAFLPVHTSEGDGASFPIRSSYSNEEYQVNTTYPPNHTHSFTS